MLQCSKNMRNTQGWETAMVNGKFFETEVGKLFAGFPFAGLDVEALMASQRKNLEALTQANQLAVQGFQELAKRQVEFARTAMDEASALVKGWSETGTAEERLQKQAAFAKQALEKSVEGARELVELAGKTQTDAFDVLTKRFSESIDEWGTLAKKAKTQRQ
jgi:phasin family protein